MNQVVLIGRLTKDPESGFHGEMCVTKFTLAVDGKKDTADFIRITTFGKTAENCAKYLAKGSQCAIQGSIKTGSYEKDGQKVFTQDVVADRVEFLGKAEKKDKETEDTGFAAIDSSIPF